jgi:prophage antirepressor-like protein
METAVAAKSNTPALSKVFFGTIGISLTLREGEPWFYAKDVCGALGVRNISEAVSKLDDDEKGMADADTLGGKQKTLIVSEAGAYRLTFVSRKPSAKAFARWLVHEVIPEISRTGGYQVAKPPRHEARDRARHTNRIRSAKMILVSAAMRLDDLGVDVSSIDLAAVLDFGRRLKAIGARP